MKEGVRGGTVDRGLFVPTTPLRASVPPENETLRNPVSSGSVVVGWSLIQVSGVFFWRHQKNTAVIF